MTKTTRHGFLHTAGMASAGATAWAMGGTSLGAAGANDRVAMGVIGMSRGRVLAKETDDTNSAGNA